MNTILRLPPPVYALILAFITWFLDQLIPVTSQILSPIMGVVLASSGLVIVALALSEFKRNGTTHLPTGEPVQFVCSGPYQWTRNPMYLGLITLLTGFALFFGGLPLFLAPLILFFIINRVFIPYEEGKLSSIFGYVYEDYLKSVRRWL